MQVQNWFSHISFVKRGIALIYVWCCIELQSIYISMIDGLDKKPMNLKISLIAQLL